MPSQGSSPPINLPTRDEKLALRGTYGHPSNVNRYVTDQDPRLHPAQLIVPCVGELEIGVMVTATANGVARCNPAVPSSMPAVAMVVGFEGEDCIIQLLGAITNLVTGLIPQKVYFVGPTGFPIPDTDLNLLPDDSLVQAVGFGISSEILALNPSTTLIRKA